jgi:hypothetical protein
VIEDAFHLLAVAGVLYCAWSAAGWFRDFRSAPTLGKLVHGAGQVVLLAWFLYWMRDATWSIPTDGRLGVDGRIYYRAAVEWLAGGDPWSAGVPVNGFRFDFAGPPPTVLVFVPFAWLSEDVFNGAWLGLSLAAALYTLYRLKLPLWWLAFPPIAQGVLVGNPQIVCLATLVAASDWIASLAIPFKAYAGLPLLGEFRWRPVAILAAACAISLAAFPELWLTYLREFSAISERLAAESFGGFSATRDPRLLAITAVALVALAFVDRRAAGWLAVPGIWPDSQFFYAEFALPVIGPVQPYVTPIFAAALAAGGHPADAVLPWAVVGYAAWRVGTRVFPPLAGRLPRIGDAGLTRTGRLP